METYYGLKFFIIDDYRSEIEYDQLIAEVHKLRFSKVILGEDGSPIDNEFDLDEIEKQLNNN